MPKHQSSIASFFEPIPKRTCSGNLSHASSNADRSGGSNVAEDDASSRIPPCPDVTAEDGDDFEHFGEDISCVTGSPIGQADTVPGTSTHFPKECDSCPEDLGSLLSGPAQPVISFPKVVDGSRKRSFVAGWYSSYAWLEYSKERDRAFCYPCRLFPMGCAGNAKKAFTVTGFNNWSKAIQKLDAHAASQSHIDSASAWLAYTQTQTSVSGSVVEQLAAQSVEEKEENRKYLKAILEILVLLATLELPLRLFVHALFYHIIVRLF